MRVTESGAIVARLLVPRLALDRRPDCRGALVPMGLALGPPDARRDIGEPVARRPAHHRRIGVDKMAGAKFPPSGVGLIVCLPRPLPDAFQDFEIARVGPDEQAPGGIGRGAGRGSEYEEV